MLITLVGIPFPYVEQLGSSAGGKYKREDLLQSSEVLEEYVLGDKFATSLLERPPALAVSNAIFSRLQQWIGATKSERLWIAGPSERHYPSKMSTMAASVVRLLARGDPLVIFYFCELPRKEDLQPGTSREAAALLSLVYSLIRQLIFRFESNFDSEKDLSKTRFGDLDGTMNTWHQALELFKDLIYLSSPYLICVLDGVDRIDYRDGGKGFQEFLDFMENIMDNDEHEGGDDESSVFKLLFTTAGKSGALKRNLARREMLLEDERRGSVDLGRCAPGRTSLGGLVEDSS